jgi:hypothetical protein
VVGAGSVGGGARRRVVGDGGVGGGQAGVGGAVGLEAGVGGRQGRRRGCGDRRARVEGWRRCRGGLGFRQAVAAATGILFCVIHISTVQVDPMAMNRACFKMGYGGLLVLTFGPSLSRTDLLVCKVFLFLFQIPITFIVSIVFYFYFMIYSVLIFFTHPILPKICHLEFLWIFEVICYFLRFN